MRVLVSYSWRDTSVADRVAADLATVTDVTLDIRDARDNPDAAALFASDVVAVIWSRHAARSTGLLEQAEAAVAAGIPLVVCHVDEADEHPPPLRSATHVEVGDSDGALGRLILAVLRSQFDEREAPGDASGRADQIPAHLEEHRAHYEARVGESVVEAALAVLTDSSGDAVEQVSEGMSVAQAALDALAEAPPQRFALESALVSVAAHEGRYPGLMRPILRQLQRAIRELPAVDPAALILPSLPATGSDRQLRAAVASVVEAHLLDDAMTELTHYIESAPAAIAALHDIAHDRNSSAVAHAAQIAADYFIEPNDLLPDHFGTIGRLDDCWLVHNLAFRVVEAGLARPDEFPGEWMRIVAADGLVLQLLAGDVLHGLEELLLELLDEIAGESPQYAPSFASDTTGHFEPVMSATPSWVDPRIDAVIPAEEEKAREGPDWGSPEVSLFLGMGGIALSMFYALQPTFRLVPRLALCLGILIVPIPLIALGASGVIRFVRVLTHPQQLGETVRRDRDRQRSEHQRWNPRLVAEILAIVVIIGMFVFGIRPTQEREAAARAREDSTEVAGRAEANLAESQRLGLWSALEAYRIHPTVAAREVLLSAIQADIHAVRALSVGDSTMIALTTDATRIATASGAGSVRVWDLGEAGEPAAPVTLSEPVVLSGGAGPAALEFIDRDLLLVGHPDDGVRIVNVVTGDALRVGEHPGLAHLAVSADGTVIVAGGDDGAVVRWSRRPDGTYEDLGPLPQRFGTILALAVGPDGERVAVADRSLITVFDGDQRREGTPWDTGRTTALRFAAGGDVLVSGEDDGRLWFWDVDTGLSEAVDESIDGSIDTLAVLPSGDMASSGGDGIIRLWRVNAREHRLVGRLTGTTSIRDVALSTQGRSVFALGEDGIVRRYEVDALQPLESLNTLTLGVGRSVAIDGGSLIATGSARGVALWELGDLDSGPIVLHPDDGVVRAATFGPGGALATADDSGSIAIRDDPTGAVTSRVAADAAIRALAWSHDRLAWITADGEVVAREEATVVLGSHPTRVSAFAISADGEVAVTGGVDGTVRVWNLDGDDPVSIVGLDDQVAAVTATADGRRVAAADIRGTVVVHDIDTGTSHLSFGTSERPTALAFSGDGELLAVALDEGGLHVRDIERETWFGPRLTGSAGTANAIEFTPDDEALLTVTKDSRLARWEFDPLVWIAVACERAGANPSAQDWESINPGSTYYRLCADHPVGQDAPEDAPLARYSSP